MRAVIYIGILLFSLVFYFLNMVFHFLNMGSWASRSESASFPCSWLDVIPPLSDLLNLKILNWINQVHFLFIQVINLHQPVFLQSLITQTITLWLINCIEHLEGSWCLNFFMELLIESLIHLILCIMHGSIVIFFWIIGFSTMFMNQFLIHCDNVKHN